MDKCRHSSSVGVPINHVVLVDWNHIEVRLEGIKSTLPILPASTDTCIHKGIDESISTGMHIMNFDSLLL